MAIIFLFFANACAQRENNESLDSKLRINLSTDSTMIELSGLSIDVLEELRTDSLEDAHWQNFFAVYEEPEDPEMRDFQQAVEGAYLIRDGIIQFTPNERFRTDLAYFSRCYTRVLLQDAENLLKKAELFSSNGFIEYKFRIPENK